MKRAATVLQPSLKSFRAQRILSLLKQFTQQHPLPKTRGRKPLYPETLILALALLLVA